VAAITKSNDAVQVAATAPAGTVESIAATDSAFAYTANLYNYTAEAYDDFVMLQPAGSSTQVTLESGLNSTLSPIVTDGTDFYWGTETSLDYATAASTAPVTQTSPSPYSLPAYLAASDGTLYVGYASTTNFWSLPAASTGGTGTALGATALDGLTAYGGNAVYSTGTSILTVGPGGGAGQTLASGLYSAAAMATDGSYVYFSAASGPEIFFPEPEIAPNRIYAIPIGGGTPTLFGVQTGATQLAVDANNVYWVTPQGVFSAPKL
jgi:hypothetical protein